MRVTEAIYDENAKHTLKELYAALLASKTWNILDSVNVLPLLVPAEKEGASELIQLITREDNAKECLMAIQLCLENLHRDDRREISDAPYSVQVIRMLKACYEFIPRLQLRKKGPEETLRPLLKQLNTTIDTFAPHAQEEDGRNIILSVCELIDGTLNWSTQNASADDSQNKRTADPLSNLLYTTLGSCAPYIKASLAQRRFDIYHPRLIFRSNIPTESEEGIVVIQSAIKSAQLLNITPQNLASQPLSLGKLILIAYHEPSAIPHSSETFLDLLPILISSLQQNVATDESLALLLTLLHSSSHQLQQEIVDPLSTVLTPLASTHHQPLVRHIAFRLLATLLSRAPPPVHLTHISSLLSDCPFPQMRVAAVGLVKEAFLRDIDSPGKETSPFSSSTLLRALGSKLFRPDPPELFASPTDKSLEAFLDSSEPARLTECLAFYYVLIMRDRTNSTGIRDRDTIRTVENGLVAPLRKALAVWMKDTSHLEGESIDPNPHALMPIASLETSVERVDNAIASIHNTS
ncbi:hypothetical protein BU17DRAFT_40325 [Hysterangium stoloniferum]|nr:hypothetical protein BU17DRAFT_40325 [Hysterangium stoloniferum]